jgi:hypothetical protein
MKTKLVRNLYVPLSPIQFASANVCKFNEKIMKKAALIFCCLVLALVNKGQSPTFSQDAKSLEGSMRKWTQKNGYTQQMKFGMSNNGSFYVLPDKDYVVFYIYDINPKSKVDFKAYLMTPVDSLKKKYTSSPYEVGIANSAKAEVLQFFTYGLGGAKQLPVKLEATPKARMYIYNRRRS